MGSEAARGLSASEADVSRLRLALSGSYSHPLGEQARLLPSFELGVRRGGGDAESGFGVDVGGGVSLTDPRRGLSVEVRARGLVAHESEGFEQWGMSVSVLLDSDPWGERGMKLSLGRTLEVSSSGGAEALFRRSTLEGLYIPEVSLVAVLDADKEGYLRSETSLVQIFGRAARNVSGRAILYADTITGSMRAAMAETRRRRDIQVEYNAKNNIVRRSIEKNITDVLGSIYESDYLKISGTEEEDLLDIPPNKIPEVVVKLSREMKSAAKKLEFEKAAEFRNRIKKLQELELKYAEGVA